jgi:hypothetical protein
MTKAELRCEDCKWLELDEVGDAFCHRYPPTTTTVYAPNSIVSCTDRRPAIVNPEINWCGEWEERKD